MWRASLASSRAVIMCSGSGRPVALRNTDFSRPRARALSVICWAKAGFGARHSFGNGDARVIGRLNDHALDEVRSFTFELSSAYMVEPPEGAPPRRQASSLMTNSSIHGELLRGQALEDHVMVMSLLMLAGAISSSAFFSNMTMPERASMRMACGAVVSSGASSCATSGDKPAYSDQGVKECDQANGKHRPKLMTALLKINRHEDQSEAWATTRRASGWPRSTAWRSAYSASPSLFKRSDADAIERSRCALEFLDLDRTGRLQLLARALRVVRIGK